MTRRPMHVHHLLGCRPTPLAHYLKALAILRLVGEQADPDARGWWQDETFHLATRMDEQELERFFLEAYSPTPLVAPWNGGSGFYPKDNRAAIDAIAGSKAPRLEAYREAIASARSLIGHATAKPSPDSKRELLAACRRAWRGAALRWIDAAVVVDSNGDLAYPPMLGTGGNDGRLDFTNNFMQRLCSLIDCADPSARARPASRVQLRSSLFGDIATALEDAPAGMFLPGSGGGPNSGSGFSGRAAANPWDYVLMLEGSICFGSALTERSRTGDAGLVTAPFAVPRLYTQTAGHGTAAAEADTRGEQWMPLWSTSARSVEVDAMLAEGRRQVGRSLARSSVDVARATARLGIARGVGAFERYGYFERNGQSFVAVPLGRWTVQAQPHQHLLDEIHNWSSTLARAARSDQAPAGLGSASRRCQEATMACCRQGADPRRWQDLLVALGEAERVLARSRRFAANQRLRGLPALDPQWLHAADDGSAELNLAIALASQAQRSERGAWDRRATVRPYFLPLDESGRFSESADAPLGGFDVLDRCATALVEQALVDASDTSAGYPLVPAWGTGASLAALGTFLAQRTDDARILALARPLMAVAWRDLKEPLRHRGRPSVSVHTMGFGMARLAYAAWPLGVTAEQPGLDPAIFQRLMRGDLVGGIALAARRLQNAGIRPLTGVVVGSPADARRVAASLAFGLDRFATDRLKRFVAEPSFNPDSEEAFS